MVRCAILSNKSAYARIEAKHVPYHPPVRRSKQVFSLTKDSEDCISGPFEHASIPCNGEGHICRGRGYIQDIQEFNALTKAGGGARCYENNGLGVFPDPKCIQLKPSYFPPILNPYYNLSPQPLIGRSGWYPPGLDFPYLAPNTISLVTNYRHG